MANDTKNPTRGRSLAQRVAAKALGLDATEMDSSESRGGLKNPFARGRDDESEDDDIVTVVCALNNATDTVVPRPTVEVTAILAWCASAIHCAIERPSPAPLAAATSDGPRLRAASAR